MSAIVGYYQAWKRYKNFTIEKINPFLFTHLIYAFAGVKNNRIYFIDEHGDIEQKGFHKFNALKKVNTNLKTLLAVGGWEQDSKSFSDMASSSSSRKTFINSCMDVLNEYDFDGIDLDWEYPCLEDKANFARLVKEMASDFRVHGFLLTAAVAAGEGTMKTSYDVRKISKYLDFIHLMTYDMHSYGTGRVNHNAPLYSNNEHNVSKSVHAWLNAGADRRKLVLGIAAYGRTFTLTDPSRTFMGAPSSGPGTSESVDYNEIVELERSGWTKQWDRNQEVPYMYKGNQWIAYDDPASVAKKMHFANQHGLGGIMIWSIDSDAPSGGASLVSAVYKFFH